MFCLMKGDQPGPSDCMVPTWKLSTMRDLNIIHTQLWPESAWAEPQTEAT